MKQRQWNIIACFALVVIVNISIFAFISPMKNNTQKPTTNNIIQDSGPIIPKLISTDYDINYRMVKYAQAKQYRADNAPAISGAEDMLGVIRFEGMINYPGPPHFPGSYRLIVLRNGTSYLLNVSHYMDVGIQSEVRLLPGYGYQGGLEMEYVMKYNYDLTNFEPQIACGYNYGALIFGKNTTNNAIAIHSIQFNGTAFNQDYNYTIPNPSIFPGINDVKVYYATMSYIAGKYIDSGTNLPFAYGLNGSFGIAMDFTNLTTSLTDYQVFDDCILSIQPSYFVVTVIGQYIFTNKHIIMTNPTDKAIKHVTELPIEITYSMIPTYVKIGTVFTWNSSYMEAIPYAFLTLTSATSYYFQSQMYYNATSLTYEISWSIKIDPNVSLLTEQIEPDNMFKALLDFTDGQAFFGMDTRFKIWQMWDVRTGSVSNIWFDWYIPYKLIKYDTTNPALEIWWGDSRGIWFTQFNGDMKNVLTIGNSSVSHIVNQRLDVSHSKGTDSFQFTISGYLERENDEICEVGIVPLIGIGQGDLYDPVPKLFTVNSRYEFLNTNQQCGVVLRPRINFQGTGSKIIEFFVSFDSDFCPVIKTFFGLNYVAYNMYVLVWERYNNGTYTQKVLNNAYMAKSALYMYSYALETGISIEDSHMLDELHFFSNGLEYSPYNVFFTTSNASVLVTDKVTNDTLYNYYTQFQDPLVLPIAAKYDFFIRYFSNLDRFGLDFNLVNTLVNGTQVTTDSIRILSPTARIVIKDFANSTIKDVIVNKNVEGQYVNLGLDIATIILSNNYNYTILFYLSKNNVTISYSLPSLSSIILRLALGKYHYIITDTDGNEILEKDIEFTTSTSISVGSWTLQFPNDPRVQAQTQINIMVSIIAIAGIAAAGIVLANEFAKRRKPNKRQWGTT